METIKARIEVEKKEEGQALRTLYLEGSIIGLGDTGAGKAELVLGNTTR